jgi:E-phenylitaconyl-CoA hydratase
MLEYSVSGHIARLTINRPQAMNAIDRATRGQLHEAWAAIREDDQVRAAILTGHGERAFCVGTDLKDMPQRGDSHAFNTFGRSGPEHLLDGLDTDKPLICAINGYAIGGGLELALACDLRIASVNAQFGLSEVTVGSMPGAGGTYRLPQVVGESMAMQMMLTGDRIDADTAWRVGPNQRASTSACAVETRRRTCRHYRGQRATCGARD